MSKTDNPHNIAYFKGKEKGYNARQSEIKKLIKHNEVMLTRAIHQTGTSEGLKATPSELRDTITKMLALIHYIEKP